MYCGFKLGDVFITRFFSVCMLALGNLLAFVQSACFSAHYSRLGWVPDRSHYSMSVWVPDRSPREEHLGSAGGDAFGNLLILFCLFYNPSHIVIICISLSPY